jgi:hypothetical protein
MIITGVQYAKSGEMVATVLESTKERATKSASEMSYKELLEALISACDDVIVSDDAKENL